MIPKKDRVMSFVFTKKINNQYKLVPFNTSYNQTGETRYLPPVSKEWKNHVYNYNSNNSVNFPVYDLNINSLIKGYFSMYFNNKILNSKFISQRKKRLSLQKIFVSKAEIKHTNNKAIITIYILNKEKPTLKEGLEKLMEYYKRLYFFWLRFLKFTKTTALNTQMTRYSIDNFFKYLLNFIIKNENIRKLYYKDLNSKSNKNSRKFNGAGSALSARKNNQEFILSNNIINDSKDFFLQIRRLKLKISLNKSKLENKFLFKLSALISKYYNKKVEFNIVNVKSLASNNDIFTELLTRKLKKEKSSPLFLMNSLLSRVILPEVNSVVERGRIQKEVNSNFILNKYMKLNISNIISTLSKNSLNNILYENFYTYPVSKLDNNTKNVLAGELNSGESLATENNTETYYEKLRKIVLSNIKYKNMAGAKFIVKGRLTRRYRADRALYKYKWKGGLKNIDSAFKGIPGVVFRGYLDSNVERSRLSSKRRIGSFGVRSWLAGK
jgi:hypothetical protein